ncbi:3589_t:CDS:2, partial [Scutellospora calospora]
SLVRSYMLLPKMKLMLERDINVFDLLILSMKDSPRNDCDHHVNKQMGAYVSATTTRFKNRLLESAKESIPKRVAEIE